MRLDRIRWAGEDAWTGIGVKICLVPGSPVVVVIVEGSEAVLVVSSELQPAHVSHHVPLEDIMFPGTLTLPKLGLVRIRGLIATDADPENTRRVEEELRRPRVLTVYRLRRQLLRFGRRRRRQVIDDDDSGGIRSRLHHLGLCRAEDGQAAEL